MSAADRTTDGDLGTAVMERGRRHGLDVKIQGRCEMDRAAWRDETEALLDFIVLADSERLRHGIDPNASIDIGDEYDRQHAAVRRGAQRGWSDPYARMEQKR